MSMDHAIPTSVRIRGSMDVVVESFGLDQKSMGVAIDSICRQFSVRGWCDSVIRNTLGCPWMVRMGRPAHLSMSMDGITSDSEVQICPWIT